MKIPHKDIPYDDNHHKDIPYDDNHHKDIPYDAIITRIFRTMTIHHKDDPYDDDSAQG